MADRPWPTDPLIGWLMSRSGDECRHATSGYPIRVFLPGGRTPYVQGRSNFHTVRRNDPGNRIFVPRTGSGDYPDRRSYLSPMAIRVLTERLILREITEDDLAGMFALDADPEAHRYLGHHVVRDREESRQVIAHLQWQYREYGIGRWAVEEKESGVFVGWAGLKYVTDPVICPAPYYDLGYRLRREFWGQGYGTECARASLHHGFKALPTDVIYAAAHVENLPSRRILTGLGMQPMHTFHFDGALHTAFNITRTKWLGAYR